MYNEQCTMYNVLQTSPFRTPWLINRIQLEHFNFSTGYQMEIFNMKEITLNFAMVPFSFVKLGTYEGCCPRVSHSPTHNMPTIMVYWILNIRYTMKEDINLGPSRNMALIIIAHILRYNLCLYLVFKDPNVSPKLLFTKPL